MSVQLTQMSIEKKPWYTVWWLNGHLIAAHAVADLNPSSTHSWSWAIAVSSRVQSGMMVHYRRACIEILQNKSTIFAKLKRMFRTYARLGGGLLCNERISTYFRAVLCITPENIKKILADFRTDIEPYLVSYWDLPSWYSNGQKQTEGITALKHMFFYFWWYKICIQIINYVGVIGQYI
jgi:hypothetical protein